MPTVIERELVNNPASFQSPGVLFGPTGANSTLNIRALSTGFSFRTSSVLLPGSMLRIAAFPTGDFARLVVAIWKPLDKRVAGF